MEIKIKNKSSIEQEHFHGLIGKYFHSMDAERVITWQGQIIDSIEDEEKLYYLVQLFSWVVGEDIYQRVVPFSDMLLWQFYNDEKDMNFFYEYTYNKKKTWK